MKIKYIFNFVISLQYILYSTYIVLNTTPYRSIQNVVTQSFSAITAPHPPPSFAAPHSLMDVGREVRLFLSFGSGSDFSLWCAFRSGSNFTFCCASGSNSYFDADPDPIFYVWSRILIKMTRICNTGLQTIHHSRVSLQNSIMSLHGSRARPPWLYTMWASTTPRPFTLFRIRIWLPKMRIHADQDLLKGHCNNNHNNNKNN